MDVHKQIVHDLERLTKEDLQRVAAYVTFLKSQAHQREKRRFDENDLQTLYAQAKEEDSTLAETGLSEYAAALKKEDEQ